MDDHPTGKWHSRGYLPHFNAVGALQHVTFHLSDSLPAEAMLRISKEIAEYPEEIRLMEQKKRMEKYLDAGMGSCVLRHPQVAEMMEQSLLYFDGQRARILEWVIMPNHVHILLEQMDGYEVGDLVGSWKKWSARKIHEWKVEGAPRTVWQRDYWDRYVRDEQHFSNVVSYIHRNPVMAGLVSEPRRYQWGSARLRA